MIEVREWSLNRPDSPVQNDLYTSVHFAKNIIHVFVTELNTFHYVPIWCFPWSIFTTVLWQQANRSLSWGAAVQNRKCIGYGIQRKIVRWRQAWLQNGRKCCGFFSRRGILSLSHQIHRRQQHGSRKAKPWPIGPQGQTDASSSYCVYFEAPVI